jgi:hypothetical protein
VSPCAAAPVTFDFSGSVTSATFVPGDPFGGAIGVGTEFSGSYTFESTALDNIPFATHGSYYAFGVPYIFTVTIGGFTFATSDSQNINVGNGPADQYSVVACAGGPFCFGSTWQIFMEDVDGTALGSDALPATPPLLSAFETALFSFRGFVNDNLVDITGQLETLTCSAGCPPVGTPVPEPGTILLVGSALAALRLRRGRGSRSSR